MKLFQKFTILLALVASIVFLAPPALGQVTTSSTTTSAAVGTTDTTVSLSSSTNVTSNPATLLLMDGEAMNVTAINTTTNVATVQRGVNGTRASTHASGVTVWLGPPSYFGRYNPGGSCTSSNLLNLPVPIVGTGAVFTCQGGRWGQLMQSFVPPTACTFVPTTLTTTNTLTNVGGNFVLNGVTNAAAGTLTLTCNLPIDTAVQATRGAVVVDIEAYVGSQTVAPTSVGTATFGTITFPTPATSETASTVSPVAAGGTLVTTSPTQITSVTSAGAFLSIKSVPAAASPIILQTDHQVLIYSLPLAQSAASAMTVNTPGLLVHWMPRQ